MAAGSSRGCPQYGRMVSDGRRMRPDAFVRRMAATLDAHDRVSKKAGQNLDHVECDPAVYARKETP